MKEEVIWGIVVSVSALLVIILLIRSGTSQSPAMSARSIANGHCASLAMPGKAWSRDCIILHLVLYSRSPFYDAMMEQTRRYYKTLPLVRTVYYVFDDVEHPTLEEDLLRIPGRESYIPGILDKTLEAFKFFGRELDRYTGVVRSNVSTLVPFESLRERLFERSGELHYGGTVVANYSHNEVPDWPVERGIMPFVHGTCIFLSPCLVKHILSEINRVNRKYVDDLSLGLFVAECTAWSPVRVGYESTEFDPEATAYRHRTDHDRFRDVEAIRFKVDSFLKTMS